MSQIRCDVKECAHRAGSLCMAESIAVSHTGFCSNNTIYKNVEGQCLSCGHCDFYMYGKSIIKPVCEMGYLMNFNNNNECWIKKGPE